MAVTNPIEAPPRGVFGTLRGVSRPSLLAFGIGVLCVISGVATYLTVNGLGPNSPTSSLVPLLVVNLALVLSLGALIAWRLVRLWTARKSRRAGARLHIRLVTIFSAIAVVPAILVAIFAAITINQGVDQWFSKHVRDALSSAVTVAKSYEHDHENSITTDAYVIANTIERDPQLFDETGKVRAGYLFAELADLTKDRGLQASYILDSKGHELGKTKQKNFPDLRMPSASDIAQAAKGTIVIDANSNVGVVRALIRMQALNDAYLLVARKVDPKVLAYYQHTVDAVTEYNQLDRNRSQLQLLFAAIYTLVALLILLAAIWLGLWAANRLVRPISKLIGAAEQVADGDLRTQVHIERDDDEVGVLGTVFNRMTSQLDAQRTELVAANRQIDARRRFTEAVLAGVSAGVIGLDGDGTITIVNRAAARLLNATQEELENRHYAEAVPELAGLIRKALSEPVGRASGEADIKRAGALRKLSVQVTSEEGTAGEYIVTFDDITDLVSAQRTAAWADVARRIAHEIKNPLTPIQLSAERLKRKYGKEVSTDPEIFEQCTDTIIRQVGDIGRMVDEFSSFARMPAPQIRRENAQELVQQAVFLQRVAHPDITYDVKTPKDAAYFECDGRLVSQALTNVIKNAGEAVASRFEKGDDAPGHIEVSLEVNGERLAFHVADNGIGLPAEHRHRLTEPYVTTRAKGTGLGLAIVRKIAEDHGGEIALNDRGDEQGAEIVLSFPLKQQRVQSVKGVGDEQERITDRV